MKLRAQGFTVFSLGDFNSRVGQIPGLENNTPDLNNNTPMFLAFIAQVNLVIVNTLPVTKGLFTRFMNNSNNPGTQSLLDYGLISNHKVQTVTSFVIDSNARFDAGSDHALLVAEVEFGYQSKVTWSFQNAVSLHFKDDTDYSQFQAELDSLVDTIPIHKFEALPAEEMLPHITSSLMESGKKIFGLKIKHKKTGTKLPKHIRDKIKSKNELSKQVALAVTNGQFNIDALQDNLAAKKAEIKELCCQVKLVRRNHIRSKCLLSDPSRRRFWSFLKSQLKTAGNVTGAYNVDGKAVFQQDEIDDAILDHFKTIFAGQRVPVFTTSDQSNQDEIALEEIEQLLKNSPIDHPADKFEKEVCAPYSFLELTEILAGLKNGKSAGYDQIPVELLKNSSFKYKQYLITFLNKIISDGRVPEQLNSGKCILIHKVQKQDINYQHLTNSNIFRVGTPCPWASTVPLRSPPTS